MMGCWVTCRFQKTISYENQSATELSKRGKKTAKKLPKIPLTMVWSGGKNKPSFRENQSANPIEVGQADKWYAAGKGVHQTFYWPSLDQLQSTPWGGGVLRSLGQKPGFKPSITTNTTKVSSFPHSRSGRESGRGPAHCPGRNWTRGAIQESRGAK